MATSLGFMPSASLASSTTRLNVNSPQTCSHFNGMAVARTAKRTMPSASPTAVPVTMKKGRLSRPMQQRQPNPQQQRKVELPKDGTPVFALFVRTPRTKIWYPLGAVQGDDRSKNLVNALKSGFLRGMYQNALDKGMAQTLFGKGGEKFMQTAIRLYPQLKKYQKDLQFGFRVSATDLEEQETRVVTKEMSLPMMQSMQKKFGDMISGFQGK